MEEFINMSVIVNGEFHRTDSEFLFDIHNDQNALDEETVSFLIEFTSTAVSAHLSRRV